MLYPHLRAPYRHSEASFQTHNLKPSLSMEISPFSLWTPVAPSLCLGQCDKGVFPPSDVLNWIPGIHRVVRKNPVLQISLLPLHVDSYTSKLYRTKQEMREPIQIVTKKQTNNIKKQRATCQPGLTTIHCTARLLWLRLRIPSACGWINTDAERQFGAVSI